MSTAIKLPLSGSVDGKGIKITTIASPGTLIHTATSATSGIYDEIWLWAYNDDVYNITIFIEWGDSDLARKITIPLQTGVIPLIPGFILQNSQVVRIYANTANKIKIDGFVNRITN